MKNKRFVKLLSTVIFTLTLCASFCTVCFAEGTVTDEITSSVQNELNDFKNSLPNEILEYLPSELFEGDFSSLSSGNTVEKTFVNVILNYLFAGIDDVIKSFVAILCVIIIASLFNILQKSFSSDAIKNTFSMFSSLCVSLTVFNICLTLCRGAVYYMQLLCKVMNAFLPVMTTMYIFNGSISTAAASNVSMLLLISVTEGILLVALLPLVKVCMCFSLVGSVNESFNLSGISKVIKNTFTSVIVFVMSVFSFIFSYKNIISQSSDSLSLRTAKFAVSSFIPIVGSSVSDALKTVSSSLALVKSSCGVIAIIVIALIVLPVIISLILNRLSFGICSGIASVIGCEKESKMLDEASSVCGFILALTVCTALLFIFAITVFIKSSAEVR
ncbi:MAG: hypothetical protein ACI3XX_00425 [Eubacteriales bacterium]